MDLQDMLNRLPPERRQKIEARAAELIAEEMGLRDLRKAMGKTQVAVAEKLGLKQETSPASNSARTCCCPPWTAT